MGAMSSRQQLEEGGRERSQDAGAQWTVLFLPAAAQAPLTVSAAPSSGLSVALTRHTGLLGGQPFHM